MRVDAEPFDLAGDQRGVLCIHGFTGTPFEMRYLGERLNQRGWTVAGLMLPGHGTNPTDLERTTWRDWYGAVEATFDSLLRRCSVVAVVGQSLGGLLALELAIRRGQDVSALAALATPLWLHGLGQVVGKLTESVPGLTRAVPQLPKLGGSDVRDPDARRCNPGYSTMPTAGIAELSGFMRHVHAHLSAVRSPLLVVHGARDHTAPVACASTLASGVASKFVQTLILPRSYHLVSIDVEKDVVAEQTGQFLATHGLAEPGRREQRAVET